MAVIVTGLMFAWDWNTTPEAAVVVKTSEYKGVIGAPAAPAVSIPAPVAAAAPVVAPADQSPVVTLFAYTVKKGDSLIKVFGEVGAKKVCKLNKLANCNHIEIGQVLDRPEGITPRETKTVVDVVAKPAAKPADAKPATAALADKPVIAKRVTRVYQPAVVVAPKTNEAGEILYRRVGTAPLNGCGKRTIASISEEAWEVLGLSDDDREYLRGHADLVDGPRIHFTEKEGLHQIETNVRLERVTFCRAGKVASLGPMRTAWDAKTAVYGERFVLPSSKTLVWMRNCFNWVILPEEKTVFVPPPPPAEPPVAETPPPEPVVAKPPEPPRIVELPAKQGRRFWETDEELYVAADFDPNSESYSASGAFYPFVARRPWGRFLTGVGFDYSQWEGVNRGFNYDGYQYMVGPKVKVIDDEGQDFGIGIYAGAITENGSAGDYAMHRRCTAIGPSITYSNYMRELNGETIVPEVNLFLSYAWGQGCSGDHTWQGALIPDKSQLMEMNSLVKAGFRIILVKTEMWRYYLQAGYFEEQPGGRSASIRFGVSDKYKILFVGAGWNFDLVNGGHVPAWGLAIDVVRGVHVWRNKVLEGQAMAAIVKAGGAVHRGIVFVHTPSDDERVDDPTGIEPAAAPPAESLPAAEPPVDRLEERKEVE
ncbi:MAG: LysM domain-containing protein [Candidatus Moraniibacteriota bacterium]